MAAPARALTWTPVPLSAGDLTKAPYRYNGMVFATTSSLKGTYYLGSGSLVDPRVVITAAHVIFDADNYTWLGDVRFDLRRNSPGDESIGGRRMTGSQYLSSYSAAVKREGQNQLAFDSDVAAIYTPTLDIDSTFETVLPKDSYESSPLQRRAKKLFTGYPLETGLIPSGNQARMHSTGPSDWDFEETWGNQVPGEIDPYGAIYSSYQTYGVRTGEGNSGGPLYIADPDDPADGGGWVAHGIVVGGGGNGSTYFSIFRILDSAALSLIKTAESLAGSPGSLPPVSVDTAVTDGTPTLSWIDVTQQEDGWQVRRRDGTGWDLAAQLEPNTTTYDDTTALPGTTYNYRVRSYGGGNEGPWSDIVHVTVPGMRDDIARALDTPLYNFTTGGDAPFYVDSQGVRSGVIHDFSSTWLALKLTGPGTLKFSWSVDCEPGEQGKIYDSIRVEVDGSAKARIDGTKSQSQTLDLTAGTHTIKWVYEKDPYSTVGQDLGRINTLSYTATSPLAALGATATANADYSYTPMLGFVFDSGGGWVFSYDLGLYLYLDVKGDNVWMWAPDSRLGWTWTSGATWPWVWSEQSGWLYFYGHGTFYNATTHENFSVAQ